MQSIIANFTIKNFAGDTIDDRKLTDGCEVSLSLYESRNYSGLVLNGTIARIIKNSSVAFSDNYILSSGMFKLKFQSKCSSILSDYVTSSFTINNSVKKVILELIDSDITVYTNFTLNITIIGDDNELYLDKCKISINDENENTVKIDEVSNGSKNINLYLSEPKFYNLKTSCGGVESNVITVNVSSLSFSLSLYNINNQVTNTANSKSSLKIKIQVKDKVGQIESKNYGDNGLYPYTLSLKNATNLFSGLKFKFNGKDYDNGTLSGITFQGEANIDLIILSAGEFTLTVSTENSELIAYDSRPISCENYLKKFNFSLQNRTVYFPNSLTLELFGDDDNLFINYETNVSIINLNDNNKLYSCTSNKGKCEIDSMTLTQINSSYFEFHSSQLNDSFTIAGLPIKIYPELPSVNVRYI